jgi:hypothetical protein
MRTYAFEEAVVRTSDAGGLRTTGTVQSNAYKEVLVPAIAGRHYPRGQCCGWRSGQAWSEDRDNLQRNWPNAQTSYLSLQAEIAKHHEHYHRAEQLVRDRCRQP